MSYPEKDIEKGSGQDVSPATSQLEDRSSTKSSSHDDDVKSGDAYEEKKIIKEITLDPGLEPIPIFTSDFEAATQLEKELSKESTNPNDPYLVAWDNAEDPLSPRNWTFKRKWAAVFVVSLFTFIAPVSSSMVAPALSAVAKDLNITRDFESQMVMSIYVLSYAIGPLVWGPISEVFGRVRVLQGSNLMYIAFNLACGFAKNSSQLLAFRFLAGFGGSAMLALGGGILADCFDAVSSDEVNTLLQGTTVLSPT
jgi:hypothetical protein